MEEYSEVVEDDIDIANQERSPEIPDDELHEAVESPERDQDQFGTDMNVDEVSCQK